MIGLTVREVAAAVGGRLVGAAGAADAAVLGVARVDSRDVGRGDLFVCVRGESLDGHDFAGQGVGRGASVVLAARPLDLAAPVVVVDDVVAALGRLARAVLDRRPGVAVVGVTGSSGKTSTKDLLAQVLETAGPAVSPPGSFNNEIGLPLTVTRTDDRTRYLVLELGSRGVGHVAHLCAAAPPRVGVVLNVGSAHLGEFGSRETVARAKRELVEALPADGVAVLNADDPIVAAMAASTPARVLTFGTGPDADVRAADVVLDDRARASFDLVTPTGRAEVSLQVVGAHQVHNALAAAAAATALGLSTGNVAAALSGADARSPWRMEVTTREDGVTVVNDAYNANPESAAAALESLSALAGRGAEPRRRTWAVLGEMRELGDDSAAEHARLGRRAAELGTDRVLAVGAAAGPIAAGAEDVPGWRGTAEVVDGVDSALALLARDLAPGDVVLVKASRSAGLERVAHGLLGTGAHA